MEELMNNDIRVKRNYKDTVFRMLYDNKKELLSLYNAVNNTNYTNEDELEIVTLENAIYMSMKDDVACLLDMNLQIYEHQSTINPNLPLRNLMYISRQLEKLIIKKDLYSKNQIYIPNPRFIVFYNGSSKQPEMREYLLSDAFKHKKNGINLELKVLQLNINSGYNEDIKNKCPSLFQYMQYVNAIRSFANENSLEEAVSLAVDYCISNDILKDFLLSNKVEVTSMSIFEYDAELHERTLKEESYEDGYNAGLAESQRIIDEKNSAIDEKNAEIKAQQAEIERLKKLLEEK